MRQADVAIRMHAPKQPDLVQRHLTSLEWRVVASPEYLQQHGTPKTAEELDNHRLILFGEHHPPVQDINWLAEAGRRPGNPRKAVLEVNSLRAMLLSARAGLGITAIPDYMFAENDGLVQVLADIKAPKVDVYFVYPEELRNSKRVAVFRDFLLAQLAQRG
jgi:DNA-binding transcriptional LysR family regulator